MGTFGLPSQKLAEWMLTNGLVHFIATDAHGTRSRRPLMRRAFNRVVELTDQETALDLCNHNPGMVARGEKVVAGRRQRIPVRGWRRIFSTSKVA